MQPTTACAEDLLLVICEQALNIAHKNELKVNESILQPVLDYFNEVTIKKSSNRDSTLTVGGNLEAGGGVDVPVVGPLLKILAKVSGDIKLGTRNEQSAVLELHKRPADLHLQVFTTPFPSIKEWQRRHHPLFTRNPKFYCIF
jgi:hypothetical protein